MWFDNTSMYSSYAVASNISYVVMHLEILVHISIAFMLMPIPGISLSPLVVLACTECYVVLMNAQ